MNQEQEKIEALSCQNRALVDQLKKTEASNKELTRLLLERNETIALLEAECRKAKKRVKR